MESCSIDVVTGAAADTGTASSARALFNAAGKLLTADEMRERLGAGAEATVGDMVKAFQQEAALVRTPSYRCHEQAAFPNSMPPS